ncbi:dihydrofolate reductase [Pseudoflavonifractor phocaeensis]|uniref:dihydrofolate reductase n=1 Tax=Pseudoflavonifractor phocaeensis TaxID=1870988 RepID=UPI001956C7F7|nr:dihydrofolate reductase [Pseudoflavonifractor phocaeensis]MBM6869840.1 dihydrofolate reductase [Pseudoflavonifractor phocaeensis]MBM6938082.1 dihydrofolate reductase [Pseudoflavonifractor phocaeensis]
MNAIVAADQNWAIGRGGDQLVYLKEDLKRFRALTTGHAVILGRKTLATFPGGRPLKHRENLILSRDPDFHPEGCRVFGDIPSLLAAAPADAFVIGGGSVYKALLDACDTVYVTRIDAAFPADTWFPDLDRDPDWAITDISQPLEQDGLVYRYVTYRRKESDHVPG